MSARVDSSLGADALAALAARQLDAFIPDGQSVQPKILDNVVPVLWQAIAKTSAATRR